MFTMSTSPGLSPLVPPHPLPPKECNVYIVNRCSFITCYAACCFREDLRPDIIIILIINYHVTCSTLKLVLFITYCTKKLTCFFFFLVFGCVGLKRSRGCTVNVLLEVCCTIRHNLKWQKRGVIILFLQKSN